MSELLVRPDYIYSTFGLDPELGELVDLFVRELPQRVADIQACWAAADTVSLERAAHQLKGAAGSYGFEELTPALRHLDHSIRMSRPRAEILRAIEAVTELCSRVRGGAPE